MNIYKMILKDPVIASIDQFDLVYICLRVKNKIRNIFECYWYRSSFKTKEYYSSKIIHSIVTLTFLPVVSNVQLHHCIPLPLSHYMTASRKSHIQSLIILGLALVTSARAQCWSCVRALLLRMLRCRPVRQWGIWAVLMVQCGWEWSVKAAGGESYVWPGLADSEWRCRDYPGSGQSSVQL